MHAYSGPNARLSLSQCILHQIEELIYKNMFMLLVYISYAFGIVYASCALSLVLTFIAYWHSILTHSL